MCVCESACVSCISTFNHTTDFRENVYEIYAIKSHRTVEQDSIGNNVVGAWIWNLK
jgi:hypothetical protein